MYKLCDQDGAVDFTLNTKPTELKFNGVMINDILGVKDGFIPSSECAKYSYKTTINTCQAYPVDLRMKLNPIGNSDLIEGSRCE
jgi:hypothetical protein